MGDQISFLMMRGAGKRRIDLPDSVGMLHDRDGTHWPSCSLLFAPYEKGTVTDAAPRDAKDFFGRNENIYRGGIETLPPRAVVEWKLIGKVRQILYSRYGELRDDYEHEFNKPEGLYHIIFWINGKAGKEPAILHKWRQFYRLELPKGCIVDERGIVLP